MILLQLHKLCSKLRESFFTDRFGFAGEKEHKGHANDMTPLQRERKKTITTAATH